MLVVCVYDILYRAFTLDKGIERKMGYRFEEYPHPLGLVARDGNG